LMLVFLLLPLVSALESVELAHDQGKPSSFRTLYGGRAFTVSFSPPSTDWPIQRVRIHGLRFGSQTENLEFVVEIWAANRTVLYSATHPYVKFKNVATWVDIDIAGPIVSESFLVVFSSGSSPERGISIGCDTSVVNQHSEIVLGKRVVTNWDEIGFKPLLKKEEANWMIRVVGGGGTLSVTPSQPSTSFLGFLNLQTLDPRLLQTVGAAATGGSVILGWLFKTRKRRFMLGYLSRIDSVHNEYSLNREECKKRLVQMKDEVVQLLKKKKIDEPQFSILDAKLTQYLKDLD